MKIRLTIFVVFVALLGAAGCLEQVSSFEALAQHHCGSFDVEMLWRLASGHLSEKYGEDFFEIDCYVRQFVREDGAQKPTIEDGEDEDEEEEDAEGEDVEREILPEVDPLVAEYAKGLSCLPEGVEPQQATYQIWRFVRFVVQHDYAYEWMRAKVRAGLGYEAERPGAWMDGEASADRLRLDKLFSNQFYEYVDKLMFRDFLHPIMTFLRRNTVLALDGALTASGRPLLVQSLETHNYLPEIFQPVVLALPGQTHVFSYTVPGLPLLLAGGNEAVAWAFTGVLVDRSNVEQIEIVGDKFYNHETEEWIKLDSTEFELSGAAGRTCTFVTSPYGALYNKRDRKGKMQEYIATWREDEPRVRLLFSEVLAVVQARGDVDPARRLEFPFNSLVVVNASGVFQHLCPQEYPSYFLYPDMFGEPEPLPQRWVAAKKFLAVSNTVLTTMRQQSYLRGEVLSLLEERITPLLRQPKEKFTRESALRLLEDAEATQAQAKKLKALLLGIYRKVKFYYLPEDEPRKQCDQLVALLEKWDGDARSQFAPIFTLWDYFVREFTFNYVSASEFGRAVVRHRALTDRYWLGQIGLWQKGTSYGECDSFEYESMKAQVNGTGHNSSCYLNVVRGLNATRELLAEKYGGDLARVAQSDFEVRELLDISAGPRLGSHAQEAFGTQYSRNVLFAVELGNPEVLFHQSYTEEAHRVDLSQSAEQQDAATEAISDEL